MVVAPSIHALDLSVLNILLKRAAPLLGREEMAGDEAMLAYGERPSGLRVMRTSDCTVGLKQR